MSRGGALARLVVAVALVACTCACGHTEVHEMVLRAPVAPSSRRAEIFLAGGDPARPFYDVALLQVLGYGTDANFDELTRRLAARATELGCDAVVRVRLVEGYSKAHAYGVCVRYSVVVPAPPPPPPPSPPPPPTPPPPPPPPPDGQSL